jgi:hypothetical protein
MPGNTTRFREIASASLAGIGIVGAADIHLLTTSAQAGDAYWEGVARSPFYHPDTDLTTAHALMTSGRNDVMLVTPDSHPTAAAITWSKNMCHLVGMYGPAMQNHRSRIGHSVTVSPLLTVSGSGNTIANLYFPYGLANATDLNLLTVSGPRNSFINCHFLQTDPAPLDVSTFKLIDLQSSETYFKNCYFGGDTVAWTDGTMVNFGAQAAPPRVVFENCLFVMNADNAQVTFLKTVAGLGRCTIAFKNCQFLNLGTSLTYGIDGTGLGNAKMIFDNNSFFAGVTDVVAAAGESSVWLAPANTPINQATGGATVALFNGLANHPDVS